MSEEIFHLVPKMFGGLITARLFVMTPKKMLKVLKDIFSSAMDGR